AARFIPRVYSSVQAAARAALTDRLAQSANTRMSANGAGYESQGQARSASPLVTTKSTQSRPERPRYATRYYVLSGLKNLIVFLPGATRFALALAFTFRAVG